MAISVPAELSAAATLIQFWDSTTSPAVWITVFLVVIVILNFCGVRLYGEVRLPLFSLIASADLIAVRSHLCYHENLPDHRLDHRWSSC